MRINRGPIYDDGLVRVDDDGVTLRRYYFPFGAKKLIPYSKIRGVDTAVLGNWNGRWRLWGSSDLWSWLPLDVRRPRKDTAVVLTVGRISPVFTPDEPGRVADLIRGRIPNRA